MAQARDQFRSSDVTVWGIVALVCGGLAVLSANLSVLVPQNVLAGLHASRLEGATLGQLRAQVASLKTETARLQRDNSVLQSRFTLAEQANGTVMRRVGAIEVSLPNLIEDQGRRVDASEVTASIGAGTPVTYAADGGSVTVEQKPLVPVVTPEAQPAMPPIAAPLAAPVPDPKAFAVALGQPLGENDAAAAWTALNAKIGTLLLGLRPLLADESGGGKRLVAGPLSDAAQAGALCTDIMRVGIACATVQFVGMPLLN